MADVVTAYDRKPGMHDASLTEVCRGTPMGELMRRYWQPVGTVCPSSEHLAHLAV